MDKELLIAVIDLEIDRAYARHDDVWVSLRNGALFGSVYCTYCIKYTYALSGNECTKEFMGERVQIAVSRRRRLKIETLL